MYFTLSPVWEQSIDQVQDNFYFFPPFGHYKTLLFVYFFFFFLFSLKTLLCSFTQMETVIYFWICMSYNSIPTCMYLTGTLCTYILDISQIFLLTVFYFCLKLVSVCQSGLRDQIVPWCHSIFSVFFWGFYCYSVWNGCVNVLYDAMFYNNYMYKKK